MQYMQLHYARFILHRDLNIESQSRFPCNSENFRDTHEKSFDSVVHVIYCCCCSSKLFNHSNHFSHGINFQLFSISVDFIIAQIRLTVVSYFVTNVKILKTSMLFHAAKLIYDSAQAIFSPIYANSINNSLDEWN